MRMMRALASLYVVATLLSLTPSLFASRFELTQLVLQVHAQVQSVPYNQPMYLGPDPTSNLATRGVYGNSAASAAETLQFQQSLLSSLGVRPGVQLVNAEAFNGLAPSQLQDQVLQKQYDIINQLQQQNPYLGYANRAAQSQQPQQQSQQPVQPQQQQQMMMQTQVGYVPAYLNNVNSPQAFGSINSQNNMLPPVQGNINNFATTQQQPPQQQFPIAQPQGFHSIATQQPQQQFQQQPFQQQQPPQQFQQSPLNMNQPYLPQQPQPQSQQPQQPSPMMPQQQSQQFQPQQPSFPQQPQQIPYQPGFANNAAAASNMPQFMAPPQFQNSASNNNNNNINAAATPPMQPPARLNSAASTPSAASTTTIASTPSPPVVRPATTSAVPPVATTTTPSASISSIPSTPPKPRPASCDDTDYHCQFYQSCYGCYGNHSLPYCGSCLALLQCNDDVSCQMMKAKAVCQQLSAAKEPQSQGCKQLMAMNN